MNKPKRYWKIITLIIIIIFIAIFSSKYQILLISKGDLDRYIAYNPQTNYFRIISSILENLNNYFPGLILTIISIFALSITIKTLDEAKRQRTVNNMPYLQMIDTVNNYDRGLCVIVLELEELNKDSEPMEIFNRFAIKNFGNGTAGKISLESFGVEEYFDIDLTSGECTYKVENNLLDGFMCLELGLNNPLGICSLPKGDEIFIDFKFVLNKTFIGKDNISLFTNKYVFEISYINLADSKNCCYAVELVPFIHNSNGNLECSFQALRSINGINSNEKHNYTINTSNSK